MLGQKFVIVDTQKIAYVIYFVIEVLCKNLFNLASQNKVYFSLLTVVER